MLPLFFLDSPILYQVFFFIEEERHPSPYLCHISPLSVSLCFVMPFVFPFFFRRRRDCVTWHSGCQSRALVQLGMVVHRPARKKESGIYVFGVCDDCVVFGSLVRSLLVPSVRPSRQYPGCKNVQLPFFSPLIPKKKQRPRRLVFGMENNLRKNPKSEPDFSSLSVFQGVGA